MTDKVLQHKGYLGSVEFSLDDNCLFGEVLFINDLVNYEAQTLDELKTAFEHAVDQYLSNCEQHGLQPDRPFSGTFNVRISAEVHKHACVKAAKLGTSLNDLVRKAIETYLQEAKVVTEHHYHTHIIETLSSVHNFEETPSLWLQYGRENAAAKRH